MPIDVDGAYEGQAVFIAGGAPSLMEEPLELLTQPGVSVLALNNTASILPPGAVDFWLGCDKPVCYSDRILLDPKITKFALISRRDYPVNGRVWKQAPSTYFFGTRENFTVENFLRTDRDFVWWKSTFYVALQIVHRLGFRKAYLIGCAFRLDGEKDYSYDVKLTDGERDWNKRVYNKTVDRMRQLKPTFDKVGFEVISATPDSLLNDIYPVVKFEEAVKDILSGFPEEYELEKCVHSSALKKQEKDNG